MALTIAFISLFVQITCLSPIFFGWKIDDRNFMVSHVVEDEVLKSFHLIGIALNQQGFKPIPNTKHHYQKR